MIGLKNVGLKKKQKRQNPKRDFCCTAKWGGKTMSANSVHKGQKKK